MIPNKHDEVIKDIEKVLASKVGEEITDPSHFECVAKLSILLNTTKKLREENERLKEQVLEAQKNRAKELNKRRGIHY